MTIVSGPRPTPSVADPVAPGQAVPVRAEGLELLGEVSGSGYRDAPSLARRSNGQTVQLTPLLYMVLEAIDGERDHEMIAAHVSETLGRDLRAADVARLIDTKLRPIGLVVGEDGTQPEVAKSNPLLALRFRWVVSNQRITNLLTRPFAVFFHPLIVLPVLAAFAFVCYWTLFEKGLASATHHAFRSPGLLLAVFALGVVSAGFHEFGHAAAARYGGAQPGAMGVGLYLVWPAFYTDVTDSYRLGRGGRVRTDLGGIYFNCIFTIAAFGAWWMTGWEALLLIIPAQLLQMVQQLTPLLRFDGYHILADITGVPDLYQRIKPTLLGLLPHRWRRPESKVLKPWARVVVTLWVLVVTPLLVLMTLLMVLALPRIIGTAWRSAKVESSALGNAFDDADAAGIAVGVLSIVALAIPVLAMIYISIRLLRRASESIWRASADRPWRRRAARATALVVVAALVYTWWPDGNRYRPVEAYERGTIDDAASLVAGPPSELQSGRSSDGRTVWPSDAKLPSRERPSLAVVMVPLSDENAPTWVFPFNRPLPPGEGDNQALAVNTTDGTVVYKVAFALVWAKDGSALNTNEAFAFASCEGCAAVAVGFQVILVIGEVDVAIPQNLAGAVNYACVSCVTYALATQLVITLPANLSQGAMDALAALWEEIRLFGENIEGVPLSELQSHLESFKTRIIEIIESDVQQVNAAGTPPPPATTVAPASPGPAPAPAPATTAPAAAPARPQLPADPTATDPDQDTDISVAPAPIPASTSGPTSGSTASTTATSASTTQTTTSADTTPSSDTIPDPTSTASSETTEPDSTTTSTAASTTTTAVESTTSTEVEAP